MSDPTFKDSASLEAWVRKTSIDALRDIWGADLSELKAINAQIARVKLAHTCLIEVKNNA